MLKQYTDRLPTLTQLPTGEDDEHEKKRVLDEEKVKDFCWRLFEDLAKKYRKNAEKINTRRECFWRKYTEILQKMNIDVATTMATESRPNVDMEDKLRKVEEKL